MHLTGVVIGCLWRALGYEAAHRRLELGHELAADLDRVGFVVGRAVSYTHLTLPTSDLV